MQDTREATLALVVEGLNNIGLRTRYVPGATGFVPGIRIEAGELLVDPAVAPASGVLHDAGHLACVPGRFRHYVGANLGVAMERMWQEVGALEDDPEGPIHRALLQCSDPEATAWAFAFGTHLGLSPEVIILNNEYANDGRSIRASLVARAYLGINGLAAAGFCAVNAGVAKYRNLPLYPEMAFWTKEV